MAKRGRPSKAGARFASGDLRPAVDRGTDEVRQKRIALVGDDRDKRASYPLGVLYARGLILSGDHYAGRRYAMLFFRAVQPIIAPSILGNLVAGGNLAAAMILVDDTVDHGAEARADYLDAREALGRRGASVAAAVDDVVIYEHEPRTTRRLEAIRDGLDTLKQFFDRADELRGRER